MLFRRLPGFHPFAELRRPAGFRLLLAARHRQRIRLDIARHHRSGRDDRARTDRNRRHQRAVRSDEGPLADARTIFEETVVIAGRSEEHTSELQSLMSISYAVFCLKKKKKTNIKKQNH